MKTGSTPSNYRIIATRRAGPSPRVAGRGIYWRSRAHCVVGILFARYYAQTTTDAPKLTAGERRRFAQSLRLPETQAQNWASVIRLAASSSITFAVSSRSTGWMNS